LPLQERVNIAVFIDFDNIEIGVKSTLGEHFDIGTILEALKERGEVVTKIAYADWTRAGEYSRALTQHAIRLVQRNLTPGGDKNGADINLALDALEMAFTHPHINAYVIVGGDSDFLSLVEKLKQYDKKVFVVGGRAFTSIILQRNCHEFIAYENLVRKPAVRGGRPAAPMSVQPIAQALPLMRRALKILADREVSPQTGLLKSTLLQLDSTFSERNYGASSFLDFAEKLAHAGFVQLKHAGRSVMVELNEQYEDADSPGSSSAQEPAPAPHQPAEAAPPSQTSEQPLGTTADAVRLTGDALRAAANARWPMYLRNVKQILRAAGLDERRYGFQGLMDLLRACQREGLLRTERDRRGGLRVFPGSALSASQARPIESAPTDEAVSLEHIDAAHGLEAFEQQPALLSDSAEAELLEVVPARIVDTTAELLGRSKPKRARARAVPEPRRTAAKKPAPRRRSAARRNPAGAASSETE
jgi:uncharacterized LabA/DUF88 family protein